MEEVINTTFFNDLTENLKSWVINQMPGLLIAVAATFVLLRIIRFSIGKLKKTLIRRATEKEGVDKEEAGKRINTLMGIVNGTARVIILTVFIMIVLVKVGVEIGPILASAGIVGLAVGFGAQELVRDYISGFFMLLEDQVRVGDVAIINGTGGLVEKIELRTITLRDLSGVVHIFQNGKVNSISNMTKQWSAIVLDIGVAYKEDVDKVMKIMKEVGDELKADPEFAEKIIEPIEIFGLNEFADSALVIRARIKTRPIEQWFTGREYRRRLKKAFDRENIEIPFPHTTVYWGEEIDPLKLEVNENK